MGREVKTDIGGQAKCNLWGHNVKTWNIYLGNSSCTALGPESYNAGWG